MRNIGISISKNVLYATIMTGDNKSNAIIEKIETFNFQSESKQLMTDFSNIFTELITKFKPDSIGYKLFLSSKKDQIKYMVYSLGILELLCEEKNIKIQERTNSWITAAKKKRIIEYCNKFGEHKEDTQLQSSIIAWNQFGE